MFRNSALVYSSLLLTFAFAVATHAQVQNSIAAAPPRHSVSVLDSTKEQDGLIGAVRKVRTESAKIDNNLAEGPRELVELTTYGLKGNRIENVSYPGTDPVVGKQEYKYDDHGNITEMTVRDDQGSIVSREAYNYEFDSVGNWIKMVTSLVVFESGQLKREPIENTYRTISYYFTDNVAKIVEAATPARSIELPSPAGNLAENLEQPNVTFNSQADDKSSSENLGEAPALQLRPVPTAAKAVETSPISLETNAANAEPTRPNRLLNLKRAADPEPAESIKPISTADTTESAPVNSAPAEESPQTAAFGLYAKGLEFLESGNLKDALGAFVASVKLAPSAEVYLNIGHVYLRLEKNNDAEKAFQQSVKLNPQGAEAQYGLGLASYRLKRFMNARDGFKRATILAPDMAKAHLGLGLSYLELGQPDAQLVEIRILERLDKGMAKQLSSASQRLNYSCRFIVCQ